MNQHLTQDQIAEWFAGERRREVLDHLRHCAQCSDEIANFEKTLWQFRGSVREWSSEQFNPATQIQIASGPKFSLFRPAWWAAATLAVALLVGVSLNHSWRKSEPIPQSSTADAVLLEQVDEQISRTVPAPMAPLMELVSYDGKTDQAETGQ